MRVDDVLLAFPFLLLAVGTRRDLPAHPVDRGARARRRAGAADRPDRPRRDARGTRPRVRPGRAGERRARPGRSCGGRSLPNVLRPVTVQTTVAIPASIVGAAILSFLGLGVQPPTADWGGMLAQAQQYLYQAAWLGVFPGVAIFLTALCFNLFGDGITDALDPGGGDEREPRCCGSRTCGSASTRPTGRCSRSAAVSLSLHDERGARHRRRVRFRQDADRAVRARPRTAARRGDRAHLVP